jgi:hypothetical protein
MAAAGNFQAIDYALAESDAFCACVNAVISTLMERARTETLDVFLAAVARASRDRLLAKLTELAPQWARAELPKRVAATEEMVASWAEEAA